MAIQISLEHFFIFVLKVDIQYLALQDNILIIAITIKKTSNPH